MASRAHEAAISVDVVPVTSTQARGTKRDDACRVRLFVVDPDSPPPPIGALDDWVRLPTSVDELAARVSVLAGRAWRHREPPSLDGDDVLRFRAGWVALAPAEAAVARILLDHFGSLTAHSELRRALSGLDHSTKSLTVRIWRLRRRVEPLGLEIHSVRGRGYILRDAAEVRGSPGMRSPMRGDR
jgi:hypothetical protein